MKQIRTALCSYGMSGHLFHAPFIEANPGFELYAVWERNKDVAVKKYPKIKTVRNLEDLLMDDSIELIIVNTPNITHFEFAKQIIEAGKHLVIEKPFAVTGNQCHELIELAAKYHVMLSVYHNRRWDSDFKTVQRVYNSGVLGELVDAEFHYDRYESNLSYKTHKEKPTLGVGSLYDLGSHLIDQALVLFGMPASVYGYLDAFRDKSQVADYFDVKLYYKEFVVTLKSSYFVKEPQAAYILNGKNGSFIKSKADIQEAQLQKEIAPNTINWGKEPASEQGLLHVLKDGPFKKEKVPTEVGNYASFYNGIYDSIRNNQPVPVLPEEALNVIVVIEAAIKSNQEKKVINL
ncbi:Predicted dehydrogenase [Nonlabens sp. Hel1_33_55]|uniref:Gfo/Idh/MocA family oxidoreductase n=1 Tax=Nonlabens sp. Hel1_33_55 TaxID=1336802 RepID=UPI000875AB04|nr:Gfo/Idh/MocA family oxidoreductase [Nonlabens sp. Hel1_33_55]SCY41780.1 Predicted dehydrogenase [Nonlabens sp. Hel1_33_55]